MEKNTMKNIINMTPHDVVIMDENGNTVKVFPSQGVARLSVKTAHGKPIIMDDGTTVPTSYSIFGEVEGLPEEKDDTIYIVSSMIAGRYPQRNDLFIPNESIRDDKGRIIGCKSLGRI